MPGVQRYRETLPWGTSLYLKAMDPLLLTRGLIRESPERSVLSSEYQEAMQIRLGDELKVLNNEGPQYVIKRCNSNSF